MADDPLVRLCSTCLHDGVLERTLARAEAAEKALEHAKAALAGDHEGIRMWMLDCGELVAKHRERAEHAEAKVAALRSVLLEGGQPDATARRRALAIISGEEES